MFIKQQITALIILLLVSTQSIAVQTCQNGIPESTPDSQFTIHNNGTVTDKKNKLMWKQAQESSNYNWQGALIQASNSTFAGFNDWRLPNIKELDSIVELKCSNPSINESVFPNTTASYFWSSSANASYPSYAWSVYFDNGNDYDGYRGNTYPVRLVRLGQ